MTDFFGGVSEVELSPPTTEDRFVADRAIVGEVERERPASSGRRRRRNSRSAHVMTTEKAGRLPSGTVIGATVGVVAAHVAAVYVARRRKL